MTTNTEPNTQPTESHSPKQAQPGKAPPILAGAALVLFLALNAGTALTPLGSAAVAAVLVSVGWWMAAHRTAPHALRITSSTALALTFGAALLDRVTWTWIPWLVVAVTCAAAAVYQQRRHGLSRRWVRAVGRGVLGVTVLVAMASLLFDPTPDLPAPTGEFAVGSQTFTWTDPTRAETSTADTADRREVIAQAWYPTDEDKGTEVEYVGVDRSTPLAGGYPAWVSGRYEDIDTHATHDVPSVARRAWPVLVFSPGASLARQTCTALCAELASRGYVVVALSHPYDSSATQLSDGRVVNPDPSQMDTPAENAHLVDIRVADTEFVLDQLQRLQGTAPSGSVLAGHLDLSRIAMVGHSLGGATAARVLAEDDRIDAAVNIDGRIFDPAPTLDRPYLWLQNETTADATTGADHPTGDLGDMARLERQLLARQTGAGGLLVVDGTRHLDFTDIPAYFSPLGRRLLGSYTLTSPAGVDEMTALTADLIEEFLGDLSQPGAASVEELAGTHAGVTPYAGQ